MNDYIDLEDMEEFEEDYLTDIEREEGPGKLIFDNCFIFS